jgi:Fe2+ transport system protein FeoA
MSTSFNSKESPVPSYHLKTGEKGKIVAINAAGSLRQRLLSMGFSRGAEIQLIKYAPLGDPIQFRLRGVSISLRRTEAEKVLVLF